MAGYEIGISGIHAAQKALTIIGNNIANAATEGYHRQAINLVPAVEGYANGIRVGQGVKYAGVIRMIDTVLESEILRQESSIAEMGRRLEMLRTIESAFGELTTGGLSTAMDEFFASFHNLSVRPEDVNLQSEVLSKAQTLVSQMNNMATMVSNMDEMVYSESAATVERINLLADQIGSLNQEVYNQTIRGYDVSNTLDQRDKLITELSQLIGVRTVIRDNGMVDIVASDISLVIGSQTTKVELGMVNDGQSFKLGLRPVGTEDFNTQVLGGTLGGLFDLRNKTIPELQSRLNALAGTVIRETNKLHVQGVGQDGSFTSLTGWTMSQSNISEFVPPIIPGDFYVRVTDSAGNTVSRSVSVTATSTVAQIAAALADIPGLSGASFSGGRFQIVADAGYTFDFLPGVRSTPTFATVDPMAGTDQARPAILLSGQYSGTANQTYTCTVNTEPPGQTLAVGNGVMSLVVTDQNGVTVANVNIGAGYTPGEAITLADGIKISLNVNGTSGGYLTGGDDFKVEAIADSDPTGFLAAAGMNVFFSGADAGSMDLSDYVKGSGRKIAVYRSAEQDNNGNAVLLAKLRDQTFKSLGSLSMKDYYRQTVIGLGNQISVTQMQYDNADGVLRSLMQQRDAVSGVDINDQASLMMVYERMFQAMARYMNTLNETQKAVLTLVS
jgi:flagellar hook-associated protein FlgK